MIGDLAPDATEKAASTAQLGAELLKHSFDPLVVIGLDGGIVLANAPMSALIDALGSRLEDTLRIDGILSGIQITNGGGFPPWVPTSGDGDLDPVASSAGHALQKRTYRLHSTERIGEDGEAVGWIVQLTDVTDLISARRGQGAATAHRDRLVKLLSHDMRSPNVAILAALAHPDLNGLPPNPRQVIERAARRALNMVDAVVRMVRAESADYALEPVELCHVVEEAVDLVWSATKEARIKFEIQTTPAEMVVMLDRTMMIQSFTALLNTVINHSVGGQRVMCAFERTSFVDRPAVMCTISYRFKDLSQGELARVFDRFASLQTNTAGSLGENDGLAFAKAVIGRHGGTLTWESGPNAQRSIFIKLPLAELDNEKVCPSS